MTGHRRHQVINDRARRQAKLQRESLELWRAQPGAWHAGHLRCNTEACCGMTPSVSHTARIASSHASGPSIHIVF